MGFADGPDCSSSDSGRWIGSVWGRWMSERFGVGMCSVGELLGQIL